MKLNKAALQILNQVRTEWTLVATTKQNLQACQFFLDNVRQFKASIKNGRLYIRTDPTLYIGKEPPEYVNNLNRHFDFIRK